MKLPTRPKITTYCVLPPQLAAFEDELRRAYAAAPNVAVVVDARTRERRRCRRRGETAAAVDGAERRRIHSQGGRRVAERRTEVALTEPLQLPRAARRHSGRIQFVEPMDPDARTARDIEGARLVIRFQAGDCRAFNDLYALHIDGLCSYVNSILRDPHEAEDTAQRAFLKAFEALGRFELRPGASVAAWLTCIARNEALCHHRKHSRVQVEDVAVRQAAVATTLEPHLQERGILDPELVSFIKRLPEAQRQTIALRHVVGLDTDEIAEALGRSAVAVRKLEHRALRYLEQRLTATGRAPVRRESGAMLVRLRRAPVLGARRWSLAVRQPTAARVRLQRYC